MKQTFEEHDEKESEFLSTLMHLAEMSEQELLESTSVYMHKYGAYLRTLDQGHLQEPTDRCFKWVAMSFIFFEGTLQYHPEVLAKLCVKSCMRLVDQIQAYHNFGGNTMQCRVIANIMFKNYVKINTPLTSSANTMKQDKVNSR